MSIKRLLTLVIVTTLLLFLAGSCLVNRLVFQPRDEARQTTATRMALNLAGTATTEAAVLSGIATARAADLDEAVAIKATALAGTVTAEAAARNQANQAMAEAQAATQAAAGTATAQAYATTATAAAQIASADAEAQQTALAAAATAVACQNINVYTMTVALEPTIIPAPGTVHVIGYSTPYIAATWVVTNTGSCVWESVTFKPVTGGDAVLPHALLRDGELVMAVAFGERVEIVRVFSPQAAQTVDEEWVLFVNNLTLFDQPHLRLVQEGWIILLQPTPTYTPIPPTSPPQQPTNPPAPPPMACSGAKPPCRSGEAVCDDGQWKCP